MKKIQGKQIKDGTIEQRSMKVLSNSITENNSVTNKEYVLNRVNQSLSGLYQSKLNLNMTASGVTAGELACDKSIIEFPLSPVMIKLNGILMSVGSDKDFYFSPDGGTTKREGGFALKGDKLYWNSSDYDLDDQDEIDLVYLVGYEYIEGSIGQVVDLHPIYNSIVVKFNGGLSETMNVVLNGSTIEVGNIGGNFVWDVDGPDEYTFTEVGESYVTTVGGEEYTVWFDGFGSLIFSIRKGNHKPNNNEFITEWNMTTTNFTLPTGINTSWNWDYYIDWGDGSPEEHITTIINPTHTYPSTGIYNISIRGSFPHLYINNNSTEKLKLQKVLNWGQVGFQSFERTFYGCTNLTNVPEVLTGAESVTNMNRMFQDCSSFNGDISSWDVSSVTDMGSMFYNCSSFNGDISSWDVSSVTDMSGMFFYCSSFNGDISSWDVSSVTNMSGIFYYCSSFNQPLSGWITTNVTNMSIMFQGCTIFNQDLNGWDVSSVTNMYSMFNSCSSFNQSLNSWDVSSVAHRYDMSDMFYGCSSFNQTLSGWCVTNIPSLPARFDTGATSWVLPRPVWGTCPP